MENRFTLPFHHFTILYYIKNSLKQSLSLCFDIKLLLVPHVPVLSPWLFQPLLYLRWKHKAPDQATTLKTSGLGFYSSLVMFGLFLRPDRVHHRASPRSCVLNIGYPASKSCSCSALLILSRLTFLRHKFPRLFCWSVTSSTLKPILATLKDSFFSTIHHRFHRSSKQARVDCPAQSPFSGDFSLM